MEQKVVMYVKKGCPYCKRAKDLLDKKGVQYEEIDVIAYPDSFNQVKSKYNVRTVPQIFIADENGNYIYHIAGSDQLIELNKQGKLDNILNCDHGIDTTAYANDSAIECEGGCTVSSSNSDDFI